MLKKTFLLTILLTATSLVFAKNLSILTVKPDKSSSWAYINAIVSVNSGEEQVNEGFRTLLSGLKDDLSLIEVIYGNGIHAKMDASCLNIEMLGSGEHQLLFKLKNDGLIHCVYRVIHEHN